MANEERGEFEISLLGVTYGMRPTYEAIQAFEGVDGLQLTQMAVAASRAALSVRACSVIIAECVRAWGKAESNTAARAFQADALGPILVSEGIVSAQTVLADMLFLATTGGIDQSGKRKAQTTKSPAEPVVAEPAASPARPSGGRRASGGKAPR